MSKHKIAAVLEERLRLAEIELDRKDREIGRTRTAHLDSSLSARSVQTLGLNALQATASMSVVGAADGVVSGGTESTNTTFRGTESANPPPALVHSRIEAGVSQCGMDPWYREVDGSRPDIGRSCSNVERSRLKVVGSSITSISSISADSLSADSSTSTPSRHPIVTSEQSILPRLLKEAASIFD